VAQIATEGIDEVVDLRAADLRANAPSGIYMPGDKVIVDVWCTDNADALTIVAHVNERNRTLNPTLIDTSYALAQSWCSAANGG
jgi:hypothetical protein